MDLIGLCRNSDKVILSQLIDTDYDGIDSIFDLSNRREKCCPTRPGFFIGE